MLTCEILTKMTNVNMRNFDKHDKCQNAKCILTKMINLKTKTDLFLI